MLTPDYYSKRNAAHQGFEGKIQLLVNVLWFQQLVFPIRTGPRWHFLPGSTILPRVINTTAKSGSKWETALSLISEN